MAKLNPYLTFSNCREAMTFYKDCLGGELVFQTVGEMPEMAAKMPPDMKDSILHSTLTSGDLVIMASDLSKSKMVDGNTVTLAIMCTSEEEINSLFTKLSAGGEITDPLMNAPWGAIFGAITDKYGKHWLFNFDKNQK